MSKLQKIAEARRLHLLKKYDVNPSKLKDGIYNGNLHISRMGLTSLKEFSQLGIEIIHGSFYVNNNKLTTLEGCPKIIERNFYCEFNKLTNFEFAPNIGEDVWYNNNELTTLKGCPNFKGTLHCNDNKLISLEGCPENIIDLYCHNNLIENLDAIKGMKFRLWCKGNPKITIEMTDRFSGTYIP